MAKLPPRNMGASVRQRHELRVEPIREAFDYGGLRLLAFIAGARVNVVVDIGFGDAVEPGLEEAELPVLLDQPVPRLWAYARETVVAEKFQAMAAFGRANTRLKDFYDVWVLSRAFAFDADRLVQKFRKDGHHKWCNMDLMI